MKRKTKHLENQEITLFSQKHNKIIYHKKKLKMTAMLILAYKTRQNLK
jgi:hypothetical protein